MFLCVSVCFCAFLCVSVCFLCVFCVFSRVFRVFFVCFRTFPQTAPQTAPLQHPRQLHSPRIHRFGAHSVRTLGLHSPRIHRRTQKYTSKSMGFRAVEVRNGPKCAQTAHSKSMDPSFVEVRNAHKMHPKSLDFRSVEVQSAHKHALQIDGFQGCGGPKCAQQCTQIAGF